MGTDVGVVPVVGRESSRPRPPRPPWSSPPSEVEAALLVTVLVTVLVAVDVGAAAAAPAGIWTGTP